MLRCHLGCSGYLGLGPALLPVPASCRHVSWEAAGEGVCTCRYLCRRQVGFLAPSFSLAQQLLGNIWGNESVDGKSVCLKKINK